MYKFNKYIWFSTLIPLSTSAISPQKVQKKPNILFICVDDLRAELGCYGSEVITPHLDKLAETGSLFLNHYTQVPVSSASRGCLLTGMLPKNNEETTNIACDYRFRGKLQEGRPESMFHQLKNDGYHTTVIGKVSHWPGGVLQTAQTPYNYELELPYSWTEILFNSGKWQTPWHATMAYADGKSRHSHKGMVKPYECADVDDDGYPDGLISNLAVEKLQLLAQKGDPFCLALGFIKPHLPFNAPKKYWDLYNELEISLPPSPDIPKSVNKASLHNSGEISNYKLGDEQITLEIPASDAYSRKLRHAYFACVSYVDAQIGKVLSELKKLNLYENTIIIVWGDHGWHLGDLSIWGKATTFETALKSTLIIKAPNTRKGIKNDRIVSTIDIYPTLMTLCDIKTDYPIDGKSFANLLNEPKDQKWEDISFGYYNKGITVRTPMFRLTKYYRKEQPDIELFSYEIDGFERDNIASEHPDIVKQLIPLWEKGDIGPFKSEQ